MQYEREDLMILHDKARGSWVLKEVKTNSILVMYPNRETVVEIAELLTKEGNCFTVTNRGNDQHELQKENVSLYEVACAC